MADPIAARKTFGPVVLLGLGAGLVVALGGNRAWVALDENALPGGHIFIGGDSTATVPLASALGYVLLAAWGVLLVTRGRVRRAVAVLAFLAAAGAFVTCVVSFWTADHGLRQSLETQLGVSDPVIGHRPWFWISLAAALLAVLATAAAVRLAPFWPEMGSRYDAPGAATGSAPLTEDPSSLDLWRAMDEGRDPTVRPDARHDT